MSQQYFQNFVFKKSPIQKKKRKKKPYENIHYSEFVFTCVNKTN